MLNANARLIPNKAAVSHLRHNDAFCVSRMRASSWGIGVSSRMATSRDRPEGGLAAPLGLGVLLLLILPSEVGNQDLAALLARQPVVDRSKKTAFASAFGNTHDAKFSMPQSFGATIPPRVALTLAGLDPASADVTGSIRERLLSETATPGGPVIDRTRKGDYGVAQIVGRSLALKGDLLKAPASTEPALERAAPVVPPGQAIAQQEPGPERAGPLPLERPTAIAKVGKERRRAERAPKRGGPSRESAGTYRLASIDPDPAEVKTGHVLDLPRNGVSSGDSGKGRDLSWHPRPALVLPRRISIPRCAQRDCISASIPWDRSSGLSSHGHPVKSRRWRTRRSRFVPRASLPTGATSSLRHCLGCLRCLSNTRY